jgi:hypothetical protein
MPDGPRLIYLLGALRLFSLTWRRLFGSVLALS